MEFSFKDVLRIIKKNIVFILIISIASAMCSFFVTKFFIPKTYLSTVKLYVNTNYSSKTSQEELSSINAAQKMVATYITLLDTNRFYSAVSDSLNEKYTVSELKSIISFTEVEDTEVFKAEIRYSDPNEVKIIADSISVVAPETINGLLENNAQLKIVDDAEKPTNPISPHASRNAVIAFLAGIIIAVIISFARDYFDVKIKYNEELTVLCGIPVLAAIPDFSALGNNQTEKNTEKAE